MNTPTIAPDTIEAGVPSEQDDLSVDAFEVWVETGAWESARTDGPICPIGAWLREKGLLEGVSVSDCSYPFLWPQAVRDWGRDYRSHGRPLIYRFDAAADTWGALRTADVLNVLHAWRAEENAG